MADSKDMDIVDLCDDGEELEAFTVVDEVDDNDDEEDEIEETKHKIECESEQLPHQEDFDVENDSDDQDLEETNAIEPESKQNIEIVVSAPESETVHPYVDVIDSFEYQKEQVTITKIPPIKSLNETPVHFIVNRSSLLSLLSTLRRSKEIAVDVIQTNGNSDKNVEFLIISTIDADYIFDVAKVKTELMLLNEIFINPKILKILGFKAPRVLCSLQLYLCLYAVNTFDIMGAMRKSAQLAKSSMRGMDLILQEDYNEHISYEKCPPGFAKIPMSKEAQEFCRIRTHYFIHMYHVYKNNLISADGKVYQDLLATWRVSSKTVYLEKPPAKELDGLELALTQRHKAELAFLQLMFAWRKNTAKQHNTTTKNIIDEPTLVAFSSYMPRSIPQIKSFTNCEYIKKDASEINQVVQQLIQVFKPVFEKTHFFNDGTEKRKAFNQTQPPFSKKNKPQAMQSRQHKPAPPPFIKKNQSQPHFTKKYQGQPSFTKKNKIQPMQTRSQTQIQSQQTSSLNSTYQNFLENLKKSQNQSLQEPFNFNRPNELRPSPFINTPNQQIPQYITIPNPQLQQLGQFGGFSAPPNALNSFSNFNQGGGGAPYYNPINNQQVNNFQENNKYRPEDPTGDDDDTTKPDFYNGNRYNRNQLRSAYAVEDHSFGNKVIKKESFSQPHSGNFRGNSPDYYGGRGAAAAASSTVSYGFSQNQDSHSKGDSANSSKYSNKFERSWSRSSDDQAETRDKNEGNSRNRYEDPWEKREKPRDHQRRNYGRYWHD